ncbi:NAD(P)/FAD-dependent oxidoreductase [Streptomyces tailanensis]|uniref:NAD(P)/FAD-dependent oxidoreductase n=1 Tax=Streptomyces tailanensis TaxID=2569858 RepID=UPI001FE7EEC0|nr:FAD-dependent oxidoreductase [Streptomyces tailanensis]
MTLPCRTLVLAGYGMAGHRLVETLRASDAASDWRIVILSEEPRPAYDRLALSVYLQEGSSRALSLASPDFPTQPVVDLRLNTRVTGIDRVRGTVTTADEDTISYDALVLATGSRPFVPPVPGHDLPGCFVYRTAEDADAIRAASLPGRSGAVIGGGLLGLEAANALRVLGMEPHVVEVAPRLMPLQVDEGAGEMLAQLITDRGVRVHCDTSVVAIIPGSDGRVDSLLLDGGTVVHTALLVFAAGVRPRDELAAGAGLALGPRGGFLVDPHCRTEDPRIWAIGECAAVRGRCHGMAAPGYRMAGIVADQLLGRDSVPFPENPDMSAKLKLLGVDVASFGDAHAETEGALELVFADHTAPTYAKLVLDSDAMTLLGGVLVGDTSAYPVLHALIGRQLTAVPEQLLAMA